jgi:ribosomal protein L37AE/L43A
MPRSKVELSPMDLFTLEREAEEKAKRPLTEKEITELAAEFGIVAMDRFCPQCCKMRVDIMDTNKWICRECGAYGARWPITPRTWSEEPRCHHEPLGMTPRFVLCILIACAAAWLLGSVTGK